MNANNAESNTDYIAVLGPPDQIAPPVPLPHTYINDIQSMIHGNKQEEDSNSPGYLHMSPTSGQVAYTPHTTDVKDNKIFEYPPPPSSPTISNNLDNLSPQKSIRKKPGIPEEMPMLSGARNATSDSESEPSLSPIPAPRTTVGNLDDKLQTTNNYINMPTIKNTVANSPIKSSTATDAVSNPGYVTIAMGQDMKTWIAARFWFYIELQLPFYVLFLSLILIIIFM